MVLMRPTKYLKSIIFTLFIMIVASCNESKTTNTSSKNNIKINKNKLSKMQVEIWSDVMCPFCYIGKRKFEAALSQFVHKENIEVIMKERNRVAIDSDEEIYKNLEKITYEKYNATKKR